MKSIGIDGCKSGWFSVTIYDYDKWEIKILKSIEDITCEMDNTNIILIDIPIGLKDSGQERTCDLKVRKLLSPIRSSSVFPVPCKPAVYATSYSEANQTNKELTGRGLSLQTWCITNKIREVDEFLEQNPEFKIKIKESHPELCFFGLSSRPMIYGKKTKEGSKERIEILKKHYDNTEEIIDFALRNYMRKELALDDIVDALCMAVIGLMGLKGEFEVVGDEAMGMFYYKGVQMIDK